MWDQLIKPGLTGAPQAVEWFAMGFGVFLATFIGRLNLLRGKQTPAQSPGSVGEIAGAIIDKHQSDRIIDAIERQTVETTKLISVLRAVVRALEMVSNNLQSNTDSVKAIDGMIDEARNEIRRLTDEMMRGQ